MKHFSTKEQAIAAAKAGVSGNWDLYDQGKIQSESWGRKYTVKRIWNDGFTGVDYYDVKVGHVSVRSCFYRGCTR